MDVIIYGILVLIVIWYLGKPLNNMINGAGEVASKEFDYYKDQQNFDLAKRYDSLGKQIDDAELTSSKHSVKEKLRTLVGHTGSDSQE